MFGEYNLHKKNISSIKRNIANTFSEKHLTSKKKNNNLLLLWDILYT